MIVFFCFTNCLKQFKNVHDFKWILLKSTWKLGVKWAWILLIKLTAWDIFKRSTEQLTCDIQLKISLIFKNEFIYQRFAQIHTLLTFSSNRIKVKIKHTQLRLKRYAWWRYTSTSIQSFGGTTNHSLQLKL